MVRVANRIGLGVPAHVGHSDCLGALNSVLPCPGGYCADLRGFDGLVTRQEGSTVSGRRHLHKEKEQDEQRRRL